jgi:hypothetical protein
MSQPALLTRVVEALEAAGIPYMLSGSLASSLQGEPRATHDIDLVIDVSPESGARLAAALSAPDLYLDERTVADATRSRTMFNLIESSSGDKVDFWLLTEDAYDAARFARRLNVDVLGRQLLVSAPEDTILMKLRWSRESGGSEKQRLDALRVYEVQAGVLDEEYLDRWAVWLGVTDLLTELRDEAEPLPG